MVTIPFKEFPSFSEDVILENIPYNFTFNWNDRGSYYSMTIADASLNILVAGIKIVMTYELIADYKGRGLPAGNIFAVDPGDKTERPAYGDIGGVVSLVYMTEAEVAILDAGGELAV